MKKSSKMTYPSKIETPLPSVEETANILGVPLVRARKIARMGPSGFESRVLRTSTKKRFAVKANARKSRASKSR